MVTNSNPYDLINPQLTSTNTFTVVVREVNVAPSLPTVPTQIVNELALLTVTNSATNFNIHSTISGYTLVSPPAGMAISASGCHHLDALAIGESRHEPHHDDRDETAIRMTWSIRA